MTQLRLLVASHVLPFPLRSGQNVRVHNMMRALRERFHVTFLTSAAPRRLSEVKSQLQQYCSQSVVLAARYDASLKSKLAAMRYVLATGLRTSNYAIGEVDLAPERVAAEIDPSQYDCLLTEYWHTVQLTSLFAGKPCVLDMHDIQWKSYGARFNHPITARLAKHRVARYRAHEEAAWDRYQGIIAINTEELRYVRSRVRDRCKTFHAPMGVNLEEWGYCWNPARPRRIGYYGGMAGKRNQDSAYRVYRRVMPAVWKRFPDAELWIVGNEPSPSIRRLALDPRVKVTGFVEDVQNTLGQFEVVVCPWTGTHGFRSRLIEAMAVGVPVVASPDAIAGMELEQGAGLELADSDSGLAERTLELLSDLALQKTASHAARAQVEARYSFEASYGRFAYDLESWLADWHRQST